MRASAPRSTILKGMLKYQDKDGAISLPIFVYRKDSEITTAGVEFHLYHQECGNRINYKSFCGSCDRDLQGGESVRLAEVGDGEKVFIERDQLRAMLYPEPTIEILHSFSLSELPDLMKKNIITFHEIYQVRSYRVGTKKELVPTVDSQLRAMFDALDKNSQALLVKAPIGGLTRHGVIMPNGDLITVFYEEEVREDIEMLYGPGEASKADVNMFSAFFKAKAKKMNKAPSCKKIVEEIEEFVNSQKPYSFLKVKDEKKEEIVSTGTKNVMVDLGNFVEGLKKKQKQKVKT